jgi:AbrB family looped-hinge helix DNA binding protein
MQTIKVQSDGRITLPAQIRKQAKIEAGDALSIRYCGEDEIVLIFQTEPKLPPVSEKDWEWLKHFDATEKHEFLIELLNAIKAATKQEIWIDVVELIEEWKATANINAHPDLVRSIETAEAEFAQGKGLSWAELRETLEL